MTKVNFVTKAGHAQYAWLQPGRPDTAFDAEGKYKTNLILSAQDAAPLVDAIKALRKTSTKFTPKDNVTLPFSVDDETGDITLKVSSKFQPKYMDAKGNPVPIDQVPLMYSGSTLRLSGAMDAWSKGANRGIALRLGAVQIIDPVSSGGSAGQFDAVEGYEASAETFPGGAADSDDNYDF